MTEEWRPVRLSVFGALDLYEVSNLGRVRRVRGIRAGRILRPYSCPAYSGDYLKVDLRQDGGRHPRFVHRLVAEAFLSNPEHKPHVNHFDQDRWNNRADNLEWCTVSENNAHARFMKLTEVPA